MDTQVIGWALGALGAIAMWLAKTWVDSMLKKIANIEQEISYIKEVYFKKEEFREFKHDLWQRLDRFESAIEMRLKTLDKE